MFGKSLSQLTYVAPTSCPLLNYYVPVVNHSSYEALHRILLQIALGVVDRVTLAEIVGPSRNAPIDDEILSAYLFPIHH